MSLVDGVGGFDPVALVAVVDHTCLAGGMGADDIICLCKQAQTPFGGAAAVCVPSRHVALAKDCLRGGAIKVATVINFPAGSATLLEVGRQVDLALASGADELDVVMPYGALIDGDYAAVEAALCFYRERAGAACLKVIIEVGALRTAALIRLATELVITSGADFVKSSTGVGYSGATAAAVLEMLLVLRGSLCGLKISGGVRTCAQAWEFYQLVVKERGVSAANLRLGSSALLVGVKQWEAAGIVT